MANRYWVSAAPANWDATAGSKWSATSGGAGGASVPGTGDDVFFDAAVSSTCTVPAATTVNCRSLNFNDGTGGAFTGQFIKAATTSNISIGDGTAGAGNVALKLSAAMTLTLTGIGTFTFVSSSVTQQTITTNGKTVGNILVSNNNIDLILGSALTSSGTITQGSGAGAKIDFNNYNVTAAAYASANSTTRTLSLGSSIFTLTSNNTPMSVTGTNFTLNAGTSKIVLTPNVNAASWGGLTWYDIESNGGNFNFISGALICHSFTRIGSANQSELVQFSGALTCSSTFTITGNSSINKTRVISSVIGTSRTITAATVAVTNADFMDITGAGAGSWNFSASNTIGDWGGNSGITFPTGTTQTFDGTSGNWSTAARWTSRVPLPQDNVVINGSSGAAINMDVLALCKDLNFTGYSGTITKASSNNPYTLFGSLILSATMNMGVVPNTAYWEYRGRGTHTITCNGKDHFSATSNQRVDFYNVNGTYTLTDAINVQTTGAGFGAAINVYAGTVDFGSFTHTYGVINSLTTTYVRSIILNSSVFNNYSTGSSAILNVAATNLTFSGENATFNVNAIGNANRTLALGGQTIGTLNDILANNGHAILVTTGGSINNLNIGAGREIRVTNGQTLTVKNDPSINGTPYGYQWFNGNNTSQEVSLPDAAPIQFTSSFTMDVKLSPGQSGAWAGNGTQAIAFKSNGAITQGYGVRFQNTGALTLYTNGVSSSSPTTMGSVFADGTPGWFRVAWNDTTNQASWYTSPDGITWTSMGSPVAHSSVGITNFASPLYIGQRNLANDNFTGKIYRVRLYADATQSTLAADIDFSTKTFGADTFAESSSNAATVSITGQHQLGDGRVALNSSTAATLATISFPQSGRVATSYNTIKDIRIGQPYIFYTSNSVDKTGNTNTHFTAPPSTPFRRQGIQAGGSTTTNATFPIATVAGNLLVASYVSASVPGTVNAPAGWTLALSDFNVGGTLTNVYYKIADGTETTVAFSQTNNQTTALFIHEIEGFTGTPTLDVTDSNKTASSVTSLSTTAGSPPTNAVPAIALALFGYGSNGGGDTGWTDNYEAEYILANNNLHCGIKVLDAPATQSTTHSIGNSRPTVAVLVVFKDLANNNTGQFFAFF
jgi:hypothetical protein